MERASERERDLAPVEVGAVKHPEVLAVNTVQFSSSSVWFSSVVAVLSLQSNIQKSLLSTFYFFLNFFLQSNIQKPLLSTLKR